MNTIVIRNHRSPARTGPRTLMGLLLFAIAAGSPDQAHAAKPMVAVRNFNDVVEGNEGVQHAEVAVALSKPARSAVSVDYHTADGTATAGSDYDPVSGTLTFAPGETTRTILVPVCGDRIAEPDVSEYFYVQLSKPRGCTIAYGFGLVRILDNEPRIRISSESAHEGDSGTTLFTFTVRLTAAHDYPAVAYDEPVTVDFATQDDTHLDWWTGQEVTCVAGIDYVATSGVLTFAPGETTKTITVEVIGNTEPEPDKALHVSLSDASPNALSFSGATAWILDDDGYYPDWGEWPGDQEGSAWWLY